MIQVKFIRLVHISNGDLLGGLALPGSKVFCGCYNIPALSHLARDHIKRAIQSFSFGSADGKLGTICVGSGICQGQDARAHMLQDEILIKFFPLDGFAARAIMAYEVTPPPGL